MADNVELNAGSGGAIAAADDIGGIHYQRVKVTWGADGVANDANASTPLPVTQAAITPGTGATNLGKAEDAAAANGDVGVVMLGVRRDSAAVGSDTDGDYSTLNLDANGLLRVNASGAAIPITDNGGIITVDGTVTANLSATDNAVLDSIDSAVNGTLSVDLGANNDVTVTGTVDLGAVDNAVLDSIAAAVNGVISIDDNGSTITVDGTVQAAQSGAWSVIADLGSNNDVRISDGTDIADVLDLTNSNPLTVAIVDGSGDQITSFGGGTQYTEGDTDATIAGTAILWEDAGNTLRPASASTPFPVEIVAGAGSGGTAAADDADFTAGTTSGTPVMGAYQSTPTAVTDGDMGIIGITADREVKVSVTSGGISGVIEDAASAGGEEGVLLLAVRRDTAASSSGTDGDYSTLNTDSTGRLHVNVGNTVTVGSHAVTNAGVFATQATQAGTWNIGTVTALPNVTLAAGTGTQEIVGDVAQDAAVAGNPVLIGQRASTATPSAMSGDGDSVFSWADRSGATVVAGRLVDDAAFTPATDRVSPIGLLADETATDSVDEGDIGVPRITLDRKTIITPYAHAAAGGATPYQNLDVDESEDDVKTSAGKVFWVSAINLAATTRYLKFYNATAATVTVGTTTPVLTLPVPSTGGTLGAGFTISFGDIGVQFTTAICIAATTGFAVADTGAPGANEVIVNLGYI